MAVVCGIALLVLAAGGFAVWFLSRSMNTVTEEQIEMETAEYGRRLKKQVASDFQILYTVASVIGDGGLAERTDFPQILQGASQENDFLTLSYFDQDGSNIVTSRGEIVAQKETVEFVQAETENVVERGFQGLPTISNRVKGLYSQEMVFMYGVPVRQGDDVIGVLTSSSQVSVFQEILNGEGIQGGIGWFHLMDGDGNLLIHAGTKPDEDLSDDSLYEAVFGDEKTVEKIQNGEQVLLHKYRGGKEYRILLMPLGINDWYLTCVSPAWIQNHQMNMLMYVLGAMFGIMVILILFLAFFGGRTASRNNRDLVQLAFYDSLTGTHNFVHFRQLAEEASREDKQFAIVSLNIHQFKFINEIFGKDQGDDLLRYVARQIGQALRPDEFFCRENADSFYLFLPDTDRELVRRRIEGIMRSITGRTDNYNGNYRIQMYSGVVISGDGERDRMVERMLNHVMFALAKARTTHQDTVWFFDSELHKDEILENYVETHMEQALKDGEFQMFLQPKVTLTTRRVIGAEALVRWRRSDGSFLRPSVFIPVFERNGFCSKLDLYMIEQACAQLRAWMDAGITPVPISVNQSRLVFYENDYIEHLLAITSAYRVSPRLIMLEILESISMDSLDELNKKIDLLKQKGFRIAMDDFGSGYSSLNTLGNLRIDELKLDQGFLREVSGGKNERSEIIMGQIAILARKLSIATVVEGVETQENHLLIQRMGCDYGQGYYYSPPIEAEKFTRQYMKDRKA